MAISKGNASTGPSAIVLLLFIFVIFRNKIYAGRVLEGNSKSSKQQAPFNFGLFPLKHARKHSDTLTGRRQESMLRLTSMASGLVHWVWGSTTKSSEHSWPDLPYLSTSYSIWPTKRATWKQIKWPQTIPLLLAWALIEEWATWCTLRVYLTMYENIFPLHLWNVLYRDNNIVETIPGSTEKTKNTVLCMQLQFYRTNHLSIDWVFLWRVFFKLLSSGPSLRAASLLVRENPL